MTEVDEDKSSEEKPKPGSTAAPRAAGASVSVMDWVVLAAISLSTAALDLWSKAWAVRRLSRPVPHPIPVCTTPPNSFMFPGQRFANAPKVLINNYLDFRYAENCGGAWGLLHGARESLRKPFFMVVTVGAVLFILHLYRTLEKGQRAMRIALPLVLGGAIGNLVDRMRLGYVVDFIDAHYVNRYRWPTFNVADIAITVGIGLMLLEYILGPNKAPTSKAKVKAKPAAT